MNDRELERRLEQQQQHDEDALALGRLVRDLLLSDILRLSNERNALLNERAAWRQDRERLDWLSRPENYDVEFVLSQAGYRIQQTQRIAGTDRFEEVLLTTRDWPTLREALDEAMRAAGIGSLPTLGEKLAQLREEYRVSEGRVYTAEEIAAEREE